MGMGKKNPEAKDPDPPGIRSTLRDNAEEQLARAMNHSSGLTGQTAEELIHELQVHQIELETQAEELRRAHLELEESRDQYLDLYDFAPLGYLTLTDKALISQANLSAAVILGIDRSRLINARFRTWIVPEDIEIWDRFLLTLLQSEKKHTAILMLRRGDKPPFHARLEGVRLTGSEPSIRVAISDITDIKQAERARRESEQLLKTVIEILPVGVMILDAEGAVTTINPEAERIWGRNCSSGTHKFPDCTCWRLEDGARIEARGWAGTRAVEKGETTLEEQIEIKCSGGIHKVVLNSALPLRKSDGSLGGALIVTHDITEGKIAEEKIQWLASFPELNPDAIIELDASGSITYTNPATRTILRDLHLPDNPALFIPGDREEIIGLLRAGSEARIYREISLGPEIFAEDITLDAGLQVIRIYARNVSLRRA